MSPDRFGTVRDRAAFVHIMLNESRIYVVGIFIHLLDLKFIYFYSCYYWYLGGWYNRPRNKGQ